MKNANFTKLTMLWGGCMLKIVKRMKLVKALNAEHGNVQFFMERLLVDVAAANYRYFLNEHLSKERIGLLDPQKACHSPLLENEEQISGLFSSALSGFCPVYRPEYPITRFKRGGSGERVTAGHVDFMVTHGEREIALENKQVNVASILSGADIPKLERRWKAVVEQAETAVEFMSENENKDRFRHPASIGLLMVRVSRKVTVGAKANAQDRAEEVLAAGLKDLNDGAEKLGQAVGKLGSQLHAHFVAKYEFPREMQIMSGWKSERRSGGERVFPGVVFLAHVSSRS